MTKTNKNLETTIDYNGMMILSGFKVDKIFFPESWNCQNSIKDEWDKACSIMWRFSGDMNLIHLRLANLHQIEFNPECSVISFIYD